MNTLYYHDETFSPEYGSQTKDCTMCGLNCVNGCGDISAPSSPTTCDKDSCEDICKNSCVVYCTEICMEYCSDNCDSFCGMFVWRL